MCVMCVWLIVIDSVGDFECVGVVECVCEVCVMLWVCDEVKDVLS